MQALVKPKSQSKIVKLLSPTKVNGMIKRRGANAVKEKSPAVHAAIMVLLKTHKKKCGGKQKRHNDQDHQAFLSEIDFTQRCSDSSKQPGYREEDRQLYTLIHVKLSIAASQFNALQNAAQQMAQKGQPSNNRCLLEMRVPASQSKERICKRKKKKAYFALSKTCLVLRSFVCAKRSHVSCKQLLCQIEEKRPPPPPSPKVSESNTCARVGCGHALQLLCLVGVGVA